MPRLKPYLTEYRTKNGIKYGADIWASSWRDARRRARKRGLGEAVLGRGVALRTVPASKILRSRKPSAEKFHALAWLGYLSLSARVAEPWEFFDDERGVIHRLAHLLMPPILTPRKHWASLIRQVRGIERRVPGYPWR